MPAKGYHEKPPSYRETAKKKTTKKVRESPARPKRPRGKK